MRMETLQMDLAQRVLLLFSLCEKIARKWQSMNKKRAPSPIKTGALISDFSASITERNKCLWFKPHICYSSPNTLRHRV
jgi:hypothetical protein